MKFVRSIAVALMAFFVAGCATTDRHLEALRDAGKEDVRLLSSDGLTIDGCKFFFVDLNPQDCHAKWRTLSLRDRHTFLLSQGSPIIRGVYEEARRELLPEFVQELRRFPDLQEHMGKVSDKEFLSALKQDALGFCKDFSTRGGQDWCMFSGAPISDDAGIRMGLSHFASINSGRHSYHRVHPAFPNHMSWPRQDTRRQIPPQVQQRLKK